VGSSLAAVVTTTAGVGAGAFDLTAPASVAFPSVTLDGTNKVASVSLGTSRVKDASGAGQGWKLQMSGTTFARADGKALPADALSVTSVGVAKVAGKDPRNSVSSTVAVPLGNGVAPATVFYADVGTGMGTFDLTPNLSLSVPAETYAGTYSSNLTITLVASP
jgi:hypothetical protein